MKSSPPPKSEGENLTFDMSEVCPQAMEIVSTLFSALCKIDSRVADDRKNAKTERSKE